MKSIHIAFILMLLGCQPQEEKKDAILSALNSKNPDAIYVVNKTLRASGIGAISINFERPYSESEDQIKEKIEELKAINHEEIESLNQSYLENLRYHSPIFHHLEGWNTPNQAK